MSVSVFEWQYTVTRDKAPKPLVTIPIRHTQGNNANVKLEPKRRYETKHTATPPARAAQPFGCRFTYRQTYVLRANCWSLDDNVSKRTWIFTTFLQRYVLHYAIRTLQHFKAFWAMSDSFPTNCFLFHKFILLSSPNIQVFRKACTKFKNPAE